MNLKFLGKRFKKLLKTGKITEVLFLRLKFHFMRQSNLKVRANKQYLLVDNNPQCLGGQFLNHCTVRTNLQNRSQTAEFKLLAFSAVTAKMYGT